MAAQEKVLLLIRALYVKWDMSVGQLMKVITLRIIYSAETVIVR